MTTSNLILLIIPLLSPLAVAGVRYLMPKIPPVALPVLAGMIGPAIDLLSQLTLGTDGNPLLALALGLAGVGIREIKVQVGKAMTNGVG